MTERTIEDEALLRALIGVPKPIIAAKVVDHLDALTRRFIELTPLVCLATSDGQGACDVSPRGDPPGFVRILDERTLLLPERPGNRIADSLRNILANPHVGLLFIIPGVIDTFRVDGRATLTDDPELLAPSTIEGKAPKLGILVDIEHCYPQCGKAFLRSHFFDPARFLDRSALPSFGELAANASGGAIDAVKYDTERAERYARREGFY